MSGPRVDSRRPVGRLSLESRPKVTFVWTSMEVGIKRRRRIQEKMKTDALGDGLHKGEGEKLSKQIDFQ